MEKSHQRKNQPSEKTRGRRAEKRVKKENQESIERSREREKSPSELDHSKRSQDVPLQDPNPTRIKELECGTGNKYLMFLDKPLGIGSYAEVFRGKAKYDTTEVAIKRIRMGPTPETAIKEMFFLFKFDNEPNIIKLIDWTTNTSSVYIIMEFCDGGSLAELIRKKELTLHKTLEILYQIISGIATVHSKGLIHRDLKPENILIKDGICKVADFGVATEKPVSVTVKGNLQCMAPEMMVKKPYNYKVDIYSIGMIFKLMLETIQNVPKEIVNLANKLLNQDPIKRPTADELKVIIDRLLKSFDENGIFKPSFGLFNNLLSHIPFLS